MRGIRLHRLLQLIALLRGPSSYNARRLAEHFGISRRNVYRDLAILELAGIPYTYDAEFGQGGGYRINQEFWLPNVGLTDQECFDLAVLTRAAESRNIPLLDDAASVRDKLLATLPPKQQDLIREASSLFDVLSLHLAEHGQCRKVMIVLQSALLQKKQVAGRYSTPHEKKTVKVQLHPRRVFLAGQAWYLAAEDCKDGGTKLYRIARFKDLKCLDLTCDTKKPFSMRQFLGNAWTVMRGDRDWHVEIEFSGNAAKLVAEIRWHHTQQVEKTRNGRVLFRATVSGLDEVQWWVLGWGPQARVRKPLELVRRIRELLQATTHLYD